MENNTFSSKSVHLLSVLLLLSAFLCRTGSALPPQHELLSAGTGRRMMGYYKPNSAMRIPPSTSDHAPGGNGRRLMSEISVAPPSKIERGVGRIGRRPMSAMDVGGSSSERGGGHNRH